jgi:hypothetical protein
MTIRWNRDFDLCIYEPKKKVEIHKEELLPHAFRLGEFFSKVGGFFVVAFYFFVGLFRAFFISKEKFREFQRKREKVFVLQENIAREF